MRPVAIHVPEAVGRAAVAEQEHHLVDGLRPKAPEVPYHGGVLKIVLRAATWIYLKMRRWIAFLWMDETGEHERVPDKEDRRVVTN